MNLKAFKWVTEQVRDVHGSELAVLLVLAYLANDRFEAWPRVGTLARLVHITERHAIRLLQRLEARDLVRKRAPKRPGYPPTRVLVTHGSGRDIQDTQGDIQDTQGDIQGMDGDTGVTSGVTSARTQHAQNSIDLLNDRVKLTGVSLPQKKRVRCAHDGCIYLTEDVFCHRHAS